jgi:chromosome segregation ATPase
MTAVTRTPGEVLREARRKDSRDKRAKVVAVVDAMLTRGDPITFTGVARAAGVSSWLVYADGVREHIETARTRQQRQSARDMQTHSSGGVASLHTDLELTRADNARLRTELSQVRAAVQRQLGQQLDQLGAADLTVRVEELARQNRELRSEVDGLQQANRDLEHRLTQTAEDLNAARTSLRRMIRFENQKNI